MENKTNNVLKKVWWKRTQVLFFHAVSLRKDLYFSYLFVSNFNVFKSTITE